MRTSPPRYWPAIVVLSVLLAGLAPFVLPMARAQDAPTPSPVEAAATDTVPPVIAQPPDVVVAGDASGATVNYAVPLATDDSDGSVAVVCDPPPGTWFPVGVTTVTCFAQDATGNVATPVLFTVSVAAPPPTSIPAPTSTPIPTNTPEPTNTPTPEPTSTPEPTRTPEPTSTPTPSATATPFPTSTPTPRPTPPALPLPSSPPPPLNPIIGSGPVDGLSAIWGDLAFPISQEYGHTAFSLSHPAMYAYGAAYGLDGRAHPGLDIGMPAGTWLYSPVDGTVLIAGGTPYFTFYGNGQPGVGELLIETDNGDQVVLGHMGRIAVHAGERVTAGQFVGLSGGENGDHLHLEARERQPGGGFLVADPRHSFLVPAIAAWRAGQQPPLVLDCGSLLTLPAVADAWIAQTNPSDNHGADAVLWVQAIGPGDNLRSLVRFELPPEIPDGCVVASATLRLSAPSAPTGRTIEALRLTGDWTENGVTWDTQPVMADPAATAVSAQGDLIWDVTAQVQVGYNEGVNHGFLIRDAAEGDAGFAQQFHSRESAESLPELVVQLGPAPPETLVESGPDASTTSTTAAFTFSADHPGSTYACSLDGEPFAACTSPLEYTDVTAGDHELRVQATNDQGATDPTPANHEWTVKAPPATQTPAPPPHLTPAPITPPTAVPTPTPTAVPELVSETTVEPDPTSTPEPLLEAAEPEPELTATSEPTPPSPTATPTPTPTPSPSATPEPTATATPEPPVFSTPSPTSTPVPAFEVAAEPTETSEPTTTATPTPTPTSTPAPTEPIVTAMFRGNPAHTGVQPGPLPENQSAIRWQFAADDGITSSPALSGDALYVGSADGCLYALDAESGEPRWKAEIGSEVSSSPAILEDLIYVGTADGRLVALEVKTGAVRWAFETEGPVISSPSVADGVVVVGSWDGFVYAVDAATGDERWRYKTGAEIYASAATAEGIAYIGSLNGFLYAIDLESGERRWRTKLGGALYSSPAVAEDVVYVGADNGILYAVDVATGDIGWRFGAEGRISSSPAVSDGAVFVGSDDGRVYAVDAASGEERWRMQTDDRVYSSPAVVDGIVVVGSLDGSIYAVEAATGLASWRVDLGDAVYSSPAVVGGMVYVATQDGVVLALGSVS